jgi:DNA primase small subunit
MDKKTALVLKKKFKEYYFDNIEQLEIPARLAEREFGYMTFDKNMIRHLSFKNPEDLRVTIIKNVPHSIYYSTSFYSDPSLPMHEKGWKGSELVFDIDADSLNSPCRANHDKWLCRDCGEQRIGIRPIKCPICKKKRIHEINITCGNCLKAAKDETIKLLEILVEDFGFTKREIDIFFSGSMGYHLSITNDMFNDSDQTIRNEIVDYVSGRSFIPESIGIYKQSSYDYLIKNLPSEIDRGWKGRIAEFFKNNIDFGGGVTDVKQQLAELYIEQSYKKFRSVLEEAVMKSGARVDPSVTTDIHRIFRLPGTIHGKTGLLKIRCHDLYQFNPLQDAVVFGMELMKIYVSYSPRFSIAGETFGPFKEEIVNIPMAAAVYLLGLEFGRVEENI